MISDIFRWSPRQFKQAEAAGLFDGSKVELLGGVIFKMTTKPPHLIAVHKLAGELRSLAPEPTWVVTKEDNVELGSWLPLPDVTIVHGPIENYATRLPASGDILQIVEVSDTTYAKDRGRKYRRYALHRIPIYWIVDLNRRLVEVFRSPAGKAYRLVDVYREDDFVPVVLGGHSLGSILVRDILP